MTSHPYYPLGVEIKDYQPNDRPLLELVGYFSLGLAGIIGIIFATALYTRPSMPRGDRLSILWFALSGILHCFFEGYFVVNHQRMGPSQDLLGQLWKEYAKSDSRYLIADPFVVSIEAITVVVWGPLSLLVAFLTTIQHPLKHPLRIIVCVAHLYGDSLYYATSLFDHYVNGIPYSRPEALYFWVYYVFMNFIWIVVPAGLLYSSVRTVSRALQTFDQVSEQKKAD
ncbi:putative EBP domain protein [Talaromyces proteolyticus]|uniref:EBP domain protein n=1 Tax=Talaromyces proteolyticus TaxID=1131652 RepID=A0AAD4KRM4_9EURO|nr:putative EBP domain protein [Talaromyces proteolyticus]KAH8698885.1 putative EBP domain protein [Talaromyces proteolyticus]